MEPEPFSLCRSKIEPNSAYLGCRVNDSRLLAIDAAQASWRVTRDNYE